MSVLTSIYSQFVTPDEKFNLEKFVEAILLFDDIQLGSSTLVPQLIRSTGIDGFTELLDSNVVRLVGGGPNAQGTCDYKSPGFFRGRTAIHTPMNFGFETIYVDCDNPNNTSAEDRMAEELARTRKILTVSDSQLQNMTDSVLRSMPILKGQNLDTHPDFRIDVDRHQRLLADIVVDSLAQRNIPVHVFNWRMRIEEVDKGIYRIDTNLARLLRIPVEQLHALVKVPFFEFTGTNLQIRRMKERNASSGLSGKQAEITSKRIDYLSRVLADADKRRVLTKIIELAAVPSLVPLDKIDVRELIELRASNEARIFRDYIKNGGGQDEQELKEVLKSWRAKLGEKAKTSRSRGLRWIASTGAGTILEPITATTIGVADKFLEKLLGDMGPIGFIDSDFRRFIKRQKKK